MYQKNVVKTKTHI